MARAKHLDKQHYRRSCKFSKTVERLTVEVVARNKTLKKRKGWDRWYSVDSVSVPGDCFTYPKLAVILHEVRTKR